VCRTSRLALLLPCCALVAGTTVAARAAEPEPARVPWTQRASGDLRGLWHPETAVVLMAAGALTVAAHAVEDPDAAEEALDRRGLDAVADAGNIYGAVAFMAPASAIVLASGYAAHSPAATELGWDLCHALVISTAAATAIKVSVDRTRPDGGSMSFPSGHTTTAFTVAPVLQHHLGWKVGVPAYLAGVVVAAGRMEDRRHYLSDVVFGAGLGIVAGRAVVRGTGAGPAVGLGPGGAPALVLRF
jgi:membrane-associated phospholipid phosphatase